MTLGCGSVTGGGTRRDGGGGGGADEDLFFKSEYWLQVGSIYENVSSCSLMTCPFLNEC